MNRPILFSGEMVKAIMEGRKTQTRRIVRELDDVPLHNFSDGAARRFISHGKAAKVKAAPCKPGDILWVRETWHHVFNFDDNDQAIDGTGRYIYYADNPMPFDYWVDVDTGEHKEQMPWKPSIHMPKEAARIFLRVKSVRAERLREVSVSDAMNEGFTDLIDFVTFWDSTIKPADRYKYDWNGNPWVWVIEFERCEKPEGWCR